MNYKLADKVSLMLTILGVFLFGVSTFSRGLPETLFIGSGVIFLFFAVMTRLIWFRCPNCGKFLKFGYPRPKYCHQCMESLYMDDQEIHS